MVAKGSDLGRQDEGSVVRWRLWHVRTNPELGVRVESRARRVDAG